MLKALRAAPGSGPAAVVKASGSSPSSPTSGNTFYGDEDRYRHLIDVLAGHCADVGRDPADVRKSLTFRAVLDDSEPAAQERAREISGGEVPERLRSQLIIGTPEQCVEKLRRYADLGVGDFLLGSLPPSHDWQTIELVAQHVAPALKAAVAA